MVYERLNDDDDDDDDWISKTYELAVTVMISYIHCVSENAGMNSGNNFAKY